MKFSQVLAHAAGASALLILSAHQAAFAEGGDKRTTGDNGINRRVISKAGYTAVKGHFSLSFSLNPDANGNRVLSTGNRIGPSFYMGCDNAGAGGGSKEVDAGFQFYPEEAYHPQNGHPLWKCFLRANIQGNSNQSDPHGFRFVHIWQNNTSLEWQGQPATSLSGPLEFTILTGDDPLTPLVEDAGWFSLKTSTEAVTADASALGGVGAKKLSAFFVNNLVLTSAAKKVVNSTLAQLAPQNATLIKVKDARVFEPVEYDGSLIRVAIGSAATAESALVESVDRTANTIKLRSALRFQHALLEPVTQELTYTEAYPGKPMAPWKGEVVFGAADFPTLRAKRVVALTRGRLFANVLQVGEVQDGSTMECTFSGGMVKPAGGSYQPWTADSVQEQDPSEGTKPKQLTIDKRFTGYDAPSNPQAGQPEHVRHLDNTWTDPQTGVANRSSLSLPIVEFPNLKFYGTATSAASEGRLNSQASWDAQESGASRYQNETVRINQRLGTGFIGSPLESAPK